MVSLTSDVVFLELSGRNGHSEANFKAFSAVGSGNVGEFVHEGSFPSLHDGLSLDGEMSVGLVVVGHGVGPVGSAILVGGENLWLGHGF